METAQPKGMPDLGENLGPAVTEPPAQPAPMSIEQQMATIAQQLSALTALVAHTVANQPAAQGVKFVGANEAEPIPDVPRAPVNEKRIRIVLEDNDEIPPGGQFISVDGRPYLLKSGEVADVPVSVIDVLDHAVKSVPVCDENRNVIGYRDRLRLPYRVVRERDETRDSREDFTQPAHVSME